MAEFEQTGFEAIIKGVGQYVADVGRIDKANQKLLKTTSKNLRNIGTAATKFVSLPILGFGTLAVTAFANFDKAMTESLAIMGEVSGPMRERMELAAREIAKTTTFSHKQTAEAYFFLASAGLAAEQSIAALPGVAKFAQAGNFNLALATDLLTDAQSALGLKSADATKNLENQTRVSDVLVKANTRANATVQQFSESLTEQGGAALRGANKSIEEGVGLLAFWADQGLKGSQAGNALASMLQLLPKAAQDNEAAFEALNIEIFDSEGKLKSFADIAREFQPLLQNATDEERAFAFSQLGINRRLATSILMLRDGGDAIEGYTEDLMGAQGITEEVAEKQLQTLSAQMSLLRSKAEDVAIIFGKALAPAVFIFGKVLDKLIIGLGFVANEFAALPKPVQAIIVGFALLLAAIGPVLIVISLMIPALTAIISIAPAVGTALTVMLGPWGLVALAIAVAIAAAILIILNWEKIEKKAGELGEAILMLGRTWKRGLGEALDDVLDFGEGVIDAIFFIPKTVLRLGIAIPKQLLIGFNSGANAALSGIANFVKKAISLLNPFNWVFGSDMTDVFREIGAESGEAMTSSLEQSLAPFGAVLDATVIAPLQAVRDFVGSLHQELNRLLGLPSVESAAEDLALAQLQLQEFDLEQGVEADIAARERKIEDLRMEIEALTEAQKKERKELEDRKKAIEEEIEALELLVPFEDPQVIAEKRKELEKEIGTIDDRIDAIDEGTDAFSKQIKEIEASIEATENERTARERELESIQKQIERLERLGQQRRLERDILRARGQAADQTLATDAQIIAAAENMVLAISDTTSEFANSAGAIHTTYIPAHAAAQTAMGDTGSSLDDLGAKLTDFTEGLLEDLEKAEGGLNDFDFTTDTVVGKVIGFFKKFDLETALVIASFAGGLAFGLANLILFKFGVADIMLETGKLFINKLLEGIEKAIGIGGAAADVGIAIGRAVVGAINSVIDDIDNALEFEMDTGPLKHLPFVDDKIQVDLWPDSLRVPVPGRQFGGPVFANAPFLVGETGPEIFVPNSNGEIIPMGSPSGMSQLLNALKGMQNGSSSLKNYGSISVTTADREGADLLRQLVRSMS